MESFIHFLLFLVFLGMLAVYLDRSHRETEQKLKQEQEQAQGLVKQEQAQELCDLQEVLDRCLEGVVQRHIAILAKKRSQILYQDDYGIWCGLDKWSSELRYFRDNVLMPDPDVHRHLTNMLNNPLVAEQMAYDARSNPLEDDPFGGCYPALGKDISFFATIVAYSTQTGQPFHVKLDTHSTSNWTVGA